MRKKIVITLACILMMVMGMVMTPTSVAHWIPSDGHKMHWPQTTDLSGDDMAVDMPLIQLRGDDFLCTQTGYINDVHIWGAFQNDNLPNMGAGGLWFDLYIYSNIPRYHPPYYKSWSMPGDLLWYKRATNLNYTVLSYTMMDPMDWLYPIPSTITPDTHNFVYEYNFHFDNSEAFLQEEGTIYWLVIRQYFTASPDEHFGWMAAEKDLQWNDNAVMYTTAPWNWEPMESPSGDPLDLAFVINGVEVRPPLPIGPYPFNPRHLNLASNGRWVKATIEPPEGYEVEDIVVDTVLLEDKIPVDWGKITGENVMLKFDRGDLEDVLWPGDDPHRLKISGRLMDGTPFVGYSEPVEWDPEI